MTHCAELRWTLEQHALKAVRFSDQLKATSPASSGAGPERSATTVRMDTKFLTISIPDARSARSKVAWNAGMIMCACDARRPCTGTQMRTNVSSGT
mmetsp:Transcript_12495/g.34477  ORF Transcript_12495/g.34477 Transcript_12495/m.34477 type:complete len:96 (+) Transcript_12495:209-496(+)